MSQSIWSGGPPPCTQIWATSSLLKKGRPPITSWTIPNRKDFVLAFHLGNYLWSSSCHEQNGSVFRPHTPSRKVMKLETAASGVQFFRLIYLLWCSVSTTSSHDINNNQISFFFHDHMACHSYCWLRLAECGNQAGGEWILKKPLLSRSFFGAVHVLIYSSLSTVICRHRPESW